MDGRLGDENGIMRCFVRTVINLIAPYYERFLGEVEGTRPIRETSKSVSIRRMGNLDGHWSFRVMRAMVKASTSCRGIPHYRAANKGDEPVRYNHAASLP